MNAKMTHPNSVKEMLNQKFDKLLVTELLPWEFNYGRKHYFVKCVCDCGKEIKAHAYTVRQGNKKHCGCVPPKKGGFHEYRNQF